MANKVTTKPKRTTRNGAHAAQSPIKPAQPKAVRTRKQTTTQNKNSQIISGYFIEDQSYKQMIIERVNAFLYCVLASLIVVCLVAYYFVTVGEGKLNKIQKETLSLNYSNEELQNELDNIQSYYNVDKTVTKTNMLHSAELIMELPEITAPQIKVDKANKIPTNAWLLGY